MPTRAPRPASRSRWPTPWTTTRRARRRSPSRGSVLIYRPRQHLPLATLAWVDRAARSWRRLPRRRRRLRQVSLHADGRTGRRRSPRCPGRVVGVADRSGTRHQRAGAGGVLGGRADLVAPTIKLAYSIAADSPPNVVVRGKRGASAERRVTTGADDPVPVGVHARWPDDRVSRVLERHRMGPVHGRRRPAVARSGCCRRRRTRAMRACRPTAARWPTPRTIPAAPRSTSAGFRKRRDEWRCRRAAAIGRCGAATDARSITSRPMAA